MNEPTTALTDFLMAGVAFVFAARTLGAWRFGFLFTGIAALTGGVYHAVLPSVAVWKITAYSVGLATFFLIRAAANDAREWLARFMRVFAVVELIVYAIWMAFHDQFIYVIADYGSGMVLIALVYAMRYRAMPQVARLILSSIAVGAIGAGVQASGFALHPRFNHNDLYHVIQIVSLFLLYRGARASDMSRRTAAASV